MAEAVDFAYYDYTTDEGETFALKVDKTWGADADSGFTAFTPGTPAVTANASFRPRKVYLQDAVSGRVTQRVVGSPTAAAWTNASFTQAVPVRGGAGTVTLTKIGKLGERIRRPRAIVSKPEPISA